MSSLKSRFFKSIFTVGFEENPFSTTILESILKKSEKNRAFSIDKFLFDPKKFNSPEMNFGRISSRFKSCVSRLNLIYESLKFLKEKSSFKYKSKSPSKYWFKLDTEKFSKTTLSFFNLKEPLNWSIE